MEVFVQVGLLHSLTLTTFPPKRDRDEKESPDKWLMNCLWLYMCVLQPVKIKVPPLPLHLPLTNSFLSLLVFISLTLSCFISALSIPLLAQSSSMELDKNSCQAKYANLSIHLSLSVICVILVASSTFYLHGESNYKQLDLFRDAE